MLLCLSKGGNSTIIIHVGAVIRYIPNSGGEYFLASERLVLAGIFDEYNSIIWLFYYQVIS